MIKEKYPWIKKESNMTEVEWEEHKSWVFGFCGTIIPANYFSGETIH